MRHVAEINQSNPGHKADAPDSEGQIMRCSDLLPLAWSLKPAQTNVINSGLKINEKAGNLCERSAMKCGAGRSTQKPINTILWWLPRHGTQQGGALEEPLGATGAEKTKAHSGVAGEMTAHQKHVGAATHTELNATQEQTNNSHLRVSSKGALILILIDDRISKSCRNQL